MSNFCKSFLCFNLHVSFRVMHQRERHHSTSVFFSKSKMSYSLSAQFVFYVKFYSLLNFTKLSHLFYISVRKHFENNIKLNLAALKFSRTQFCRKGHVLSIHWASISTAIGSSWIADVWIIGYIFSSHVIIELNQFEIVSRWQGLC